jgi:uncharacterized protein YecE (DUF72 family)
MDFFIGCSGFHYKHWKGSFYPDNLPQNKWFDFYCRFFNTLELNVTFYRFPQLHVLQKWYQKSPDNFVFAVKAPRLITHYKKLQGTKELVDEFYRTTDKGLKQKLGSILFQFPPSFIFSEKRLEQIISNLNNAYCNTVEFRHLSWWRQDVYDLLGQYQINFCGINHPDFPKDIIDNTDHLYYRLHGGTQLYTSNYSLRELDELIQEIKAIKKIVKAYIYFNNDVKGYAVSNAQYLIEKTHSLNKADNLIVRCT